MPEVNHLGTEPSTGPTRLLYRADLGRCIPIGEPKIDQEPAVDGPSFARAWSGPRLRLRLKPWPFALGVVLGVGAVVLVELAGFLILWASSLGSPSE